MQTEPAQAPSGDAAQASDPIPFATAIVSVFFGVGIALTLLGTGAVTYTVWRRCLRLLSRPVPPSLGSIARTAIAERVG